jgi:hypothetical protein
MQALPAASRCMVELTAWAARPAFQAMKLLPEGASDKVDLLCNKAACYYQLKK